MNGEEADNGGLDLRLREASAGIHPVLSSVPDRTKEVIDVVATLAARWNALLAHTQDVIVVERISDGVIVDASQSYARLLGRPDVVGRSIKELEVDGYSDEFRDGLIATIREEQERRYWFTIRDCEFEFLSKALDEDHLIHLGRDITEQRRLDGLKDDFIAFASHELRSPATVVTGIAQTLAQRSDELTIKQIRTLRQTMFTSATELQRLIEELLDLTKIEAGWHEPRREPTNLNRFVRKVLRPYDGDLRIEAAGDLRVRVDTAAVDRVVTNLVSNALKYGEEPVVVTLERDGDTARVRVADSGHGVSPEFQPLLFERFTRDGRSREKSGAGLGLAIASRFASSVGGSLSYEDGDPRGAVFVFEFPAG